MKNFLVRLLLAAVSLPLFSLQFADITIGESRNQHPVELAWKATGLKIEIVSTEAWLKLNDQWLVGNKLKELGKRIAKEFDLKSSVVRSEGDDQGFAYFYLEGLQADGTTVTLVLQSYKDLGTAETQLGLYTVRGGKIEELQTYLGNIQKKASQLTQGEVQLTVSVSGSCQGKLLPELARDMSSKVFSTLNARIVESVSQIDGCMIKGYSEKLSKGDQLGLVPYNLEFGTIYDEINNRTEVVLSLH